MANPNLLAATSMYGKVVAGTITSSDVAVVTAASDTFVKIVSIKLSAHTDDVAYIGVKKSGESTVEFYRGTIDNDTGLVSSEEQAPVSILGKGTVYLEEGDALMINSDTGGDITYVISYEIYDDA